MLMLLNILQFNSKTNKVVLQRLSIPACSREMFVYGFLSNIGLLINFKIEGEKKN